MTLEGLHNQKICAGEYQSQVTLAKNRKNHKNHDKDTNFIMENNIR